MHPNISEITKLLETRSISISDLLSFRKAREMPFRFHPLGFFSCTLVSEGNQKVRLHYWPITEGQQQSTDCQIHNHIFEFESWVLVGGIENVVYQPDTVGKEFALYKAEYVSDLSILHKTEKIIRLSESQKYQYYAGSKYKVPYGVLHESRRVGEGAALTVLLTKDVDSRAPFVAGPVHGDTKYVYRRSELNDSVIEAMLANL